MARKNDDNTWIFIIILIALLLLFFFFRGKVIETEEPFISVRLYDANKNLITTNLFSIVEGVPGVYYIDLSVNVKNTGSIALTCDITSLTPTAFNSAMTKTTKTVNPSLFVGWTSGLISTLQFEGAPTPDRFTAEVTCKYTVGTEITILPPKSGYLDLSILPDGTTTGSFEVTVSRGGVPTEFCGDTICQADETAISCPQDCAVASYVKFRTSDLSYASGMAIAYTDACGSTLTAYGSIGGGNIASSNDCPWEMPNRGYTTLLISTIPGTQVYGYTVTSISLWKNPSTNRLVVCGKRPTGGYVEYVAFDSTDPDASKVNIQATSIDSSKEVAC